MADMQESLDISPEAVSQAAEAMMAAKPAYRDLINVSGRIFAAQEEARQRIRLEPVVIPEELLTIQRREQLPLVPVSVCLSADLNEAHAWGRHVARVAGESAKRVGFVASGSVSHKLVRGPEKAPLPADQELDHRFARLLADGELEKLWAWLPEFTRATEAEMGGRHLAMLLGAVMESGHRFVPAVHAYGPSSGSGNYVISLTGL